LWSVIWPQPRPLLIASLAALPALAVILLALPGSPFQIGFGRATNLPANLGSVCFFPALAVTVRMLTDVDQTLVDWVPLVVVAVAGAGAFVAIIATVSNDMREQPWTLLGCALLVAFYAFGVVGEANTLLDRSEAALHSSRVLGKHINYGRGKTKTYVLRLSPWGPVNEPGNVEVSYDVYDRLKQDGPACVLLHSGALGMPWFIVKPCR
jgi:hypothetical protein